MRIVLITDSHGQGMGEEMAKVDDTLEVLTVSVGARSSLVWRKVEEDSARIWNFWPEVIVVHLGHNDVVWHPVHNTEPLHPQEVFSLMLEKLQRLKEEYPECRIIMSNLFPRTVGPHFPDARKRMYNAMVYQFGNTMREHLPGRGIDFVLNGVLWFKPSEAREHAVYLRADGLHLSLLGRSAVASSWVRAIQRGRPTRMMGVESFLSMDSQRLTTD
jgi:lysophospholipase L1-like esterase